MKASNLQVLVFSISVLSLVLSISAMVNVRSLSIPSAQIEFGDTFRQWDHERRVETTQTHAGLYAKDSTDTLVGFHWSVYSYTEPNNEAIELKFSTELSPPVDWDKWMVTAIYGSDAISKWE